MYTTYTNYLESIVWILEGPSSNLYLRLNKKIYLDWFALCCSFFVNLECIKVIDILIFKFLVNIVILVLKIALSWFKYWQFWVISVFHFTCVSLLSLEQKLLKLSAQQINNKWSKSLNHNQTRVGSTKSINS